MTMARGHVHTNSITQWLYVIISLTSLFFAMHIIIPKTNRLMTHVTLHFNHAHSTTSRNCAHHGIRIILGFFPHLKINHDNRDTYYQHCITDEHPCVTFFATIIQECCSGRQWSLLNYIYNRLYQLNALIHRGSPYQNISRHFSHVNGRKSKGRKQYNYK